MRKDYSNTINELITDSDLGPKTAANERARFIITPGHGYLEVEDTPENREFFTQYDYERGGMLYLEEDEDAPKWFAAHGMKNSDDVPTVYVEDEPGLAFLDTDLEG